MATAHIVGLAWMAAILVLVATAGAAEGPPRDRTTAVRTTDFLNSIGVVSTFPDRGQPIEKTIEMVKYVGFRWVRGGIEGLTAKGPTTVQTYLKLHRQTMYCAFRHPGQ